jgi:hypothetical protein
MGSDDASSSATRGAGETAPGSSDTTGGRPTTSSGDSACETGASWGARRDFAFEHASAGVDFVDAVSDLVRRHDVSPIAVSTHMDPGCEWMVAFSAPDAAGAISARHATAFTPMLRHPAGLWTAAPQANGWFYVVDETSHDVWIPLGDVTGSATYGESSCASLSQVRVSASIPAFAANITLDTAAGVRTVRDLMGAEPSARGWDVRFVFSADLAR